jgi:hypothetical protein
MPLSATKFLQYNVPSAVPTGCEVADRYLVSVRSGYESPRYWASFDTVTETARAFTGIPQGTSATAPRSLVAYGNYAYSTSRSGIHRLNPANGGVLLINSFSVTDPPYAVLVGTKLWVIVASNTARYWDFATGTATVEAWSWPASISRHPFYAYGYLWFPDSSSNITRLDLATGTATTASVSGGLQVTRTMVAVDGYLWWGKISGGVVKFDPATMTILDTYSSELTASWEREIVVGSDGRLYLFWSERMYGFDPYTLEWLPSPNYEYDDDLPSNTSIGSTNQSYWFARSNGELWAIHSSPSSW